MPEITKDDGLVNHKYIKKLLVVVHTQGTISPQLSENQWSIYLTLQGEPQSSVRMNMQRLDDDDPTSTLTWSEHDYWVTNSAIKFWRLNVPDTLVVSHVATLSYEKEREMYEFAGGGSGCRYWVWTVLSDLVDRGWLNRADVSHVGLQLRYQWHRTRPKVEQAWVQGSFFTH